MLQLGRYEQIGSGVYNVSKYLPLYSGGATPKFDEQADMFVTTMPLTPDAGKQSEDLVAGPVTPEVTPEVQRLLPLCITPHTRRELQDALGLKNDDHFRLKYILPALNSE